MSLNQAPVSYLTLGLSNSQHLEEKKLKWNTSCKYIFTILFIAEILEHCRNSGSPHI